MTTAHRATFKAAKATYGGIEQGNYSTFGTGTTAQGVRDLAGQNKLKRRVEGQGTEDEYRNAQFKEDLEKREADHLAKRAKLADQYDDSDDDVQSAFLEDVKEGSKDKVEETSDESSSEDSSDDDQEELMRELEKIKEERALEKAKASVEGNPLLCNIAEGTDSGSLKIAKRWDDDTVFRNQAKGTNGPAVKRFVNDTVRNDFHRRFINQYIK